MVGLAGWESGSGIRGAGGGGGEAADCRIFHGEWLSNSATLVVKVARFSTRAG